MGDQTEPKPGMRCSVRARPLGGLAGRFSLPLGSHIISTRTVLKTPRTSVRVQELEKELRRVEQERDILKKALAFFSQKT